MKAVLILSHQKGFEADGVIDALKAKGIPFFRFNGDAGEIASRVSCQFGTTESATLECDGVIVDIGGIGVGWCQQLPPYLGEPGGSDEVIQTENLWSAFCGLEGSMAVPWLNRPSAVVTASNKIVQLRLARRIGLPIPKTIVSNRPNDIRSFVAELGAGNIVVKNLATPWVTVGNTTLASYTKVILQEWLQSDGELSLCPAIYQQFHRRRWDYRVVLIDNKTFVARSGSSVGQEEDIRLASTTGDNFVPCGFDQELLIKLKAMVAGLGLNYCAADFIEDQEGNIYFLEINTCGAWWWLDEMHDRGITNAFVEFFSEIILK